MLLERTSAAIGTPYIVSDCWCRLALAESIEGTVFFAGEATHEAVNPCLQAAFETGERAAKEILRASVFPRL